MDIDEMFLEPISLSGSVIHTKKQITYPENRYSAKLREISFPKIPMPEKSILIQGPTGRGKTLYSKYLETVFVSNEIKSYGFFNELEFEIKCRSFDYDFIKDSAYLTNKKYLIMDQLFSSIARIVANKHIYATYEYFIDIIYQMKYQVDPIIVIGLTNKNFMELPIPEDTKRKITEIFTEKEYL